MERIKQFTFEHDKVSLNCAKFTSHITAEIVLGNVAKQNKKTLLS